MRVIYCTYSTVFREVKYSKFDFTTRNVYEYKGGKKGGGRTPRPRPLADSGRFNAPPPPEISREKNVPNLDKNVCMSNTHNTA